MTKKSPFSIKQHSHSVCSLPGLLCSLFYRQGLSKLLYQFLLSHLKEHLIVSMGNLLSKKPTLHHSKPCLSIIVYFCFAVADFAFEAATLSDLFSCDNVLQYLDLILFAQFVAFLMTMSHIILHYHLYIQMQLSIKSKLL